MAAATWCRALRRRAGKAGQVSNFVTDSANYGKWSQYFNGIDVDRQRRAARLRLPVGPAPDRPLRTTATSARIFRSWQPPPWERVLSAPASITGGHAARARTAAPHTGCSRTSEACRRTCSKDRCPGCGDLSEQAGRDAGRQLCACRTRRAPCSAGIFRATPQRDGQPGRARRAVRRPGQRARLPRREAPRFGARGSIVAIDSTTRSTRARCCPTIRRSFPMARGCSRSPS